MSLENNRDICPATGGDIDDFVFQTRVNVIRELDLRARKVYGIRYHLVNEAYTSRTDALAGDQIRNQEYGKSRGVKRGLYQSSTGTLLNADVNGAIN